jgi:hypothetical protein
MSNMQKKSLGAWEKPLVQPTPKSITANTNTTTVANVGAKPKSVFPSLTSKKLDRDSEALLKFTLIASSPIKNLKLTSNCAYSLYVNDTFFGDGGLRCVPKESIVDEFDIENGSSNIYIYLHYIGDKNSVWHRMLFPDPFFYDFDGSNTWICEKSNWFLFGTKISSQLPRQNIITSNQISFSSKPEWELLDLVSVPNFDWKFIERKFKFLYKEKIFSSDPKQQKRIPSKFPRFFQKTNTKDYSDIPNIDSLQNLQLKGKENLMEILHKISDPNATSYTFDLGQIGLHKLFVSTSDPIIVYYSEIGDFKTCWDTPNRNKVWMADAFMSNKPNLTSIEWRGCRYVHIVTTRTCNFQIKSIRKEYDFNWIPKTFIDRKNQKIYEACMNNLIACVDGGIVDTCWRERAQWVGDAYMSTKAIALMCDPTKSQPIIDNVLRQISQSYNPLNGMVQGAYPIKKHTNLDFYMPTYHLLWCLTVLEHNKQEYFDIVRKSLLLWEEKYTNQIKKIISNAPGWNFVDWFDTYSSGRTDEGVNYSGGNAFVNILYIHLCRHFHVETKVTQESIDNAFLKDNMYTLYQDSPSSLQATSIAIIYLQTSDSVKQRFAGYLFANGMSEHTMYYGYYIAKALGFISPDIQKDYIIKKYYDCANIFGTIIEKIDPESSLAHGWSVGIVEFI